MTKQEVINYITETPGNTNPAVLSSILNEFGVSDNKQEIELSATENKVYTPAEGKVYNKVTVNVPAPPSDLSTAEVTLINSSGYQTFIYAPTYFDNESGHSSNYYVYLDGQNEVVLDIILYKGEAFISSEDNVHWFFTDAIGDIEIDSQGSNLAFVRGNGTITLAHQ